MRGGSLCVDCDHSPPPAPALRRPRAAAGGAGRRRRPSRAAWSASRRRRTPGRAGGRIRSVLRIGIGRKMRRERPRRLKRPRRTRRTTRTRDEDEDEERRDEDKDRRTRDQQRQCHQKGSSKTTPGRSDGRTCPALRSAGARGSGQAGPGARAGWGQRGAIGMATERSAATRLRDGTWVGASRSRMLCTAPGKHSCERRYYRDDAKKR